MTALDYSLQVMWKGMLSIVIVIAIIIISTYILQFVMNKIKKYRDKKAIVDSENKDN